MHNIMGHTTRKPNETLVALSIKLKTYMLPEHKLVELQQAMKDDTVLQKLQKSHEDKVTSREYWKLSTKAPFAVQR